MSSGQVDYPVMPNHGAARFHVVDRRSKHRLGAELDGVQVYTFPIHMFSKRWFLDTWGPGSFDVGFEAEDGTQRGRKAFDLATPREDVQDEEFRSSSGSPLSEGIAMLGALKKIANDEAGGIISSTKEMVAAQTTMMGQVLQAFAGQQKVAQASASTEIDRRIERLENLIGTIAQHVQQGGVAPGPDPEEEEEELTEEEEEEEKYEEEIDALIEAAKSDDALTAVLGFAGEKAARAGMTLAAEFAKQQGGNPIEIAKKLVGMAQGLFAKPQPNGVPRIVEAPQSTQPPPVIVKS